MSFKTFAITMCAIAGILSGCKPKAEQQYEPTDDVFTSGKTTIRMYCIKHGSIRMMINDKWLYVDPVTKAAQPETDYTQLPKADFILVTHEHFDHVDTLALAQLAKDGTQVIANRNSHDIIGYGDVMANGDEMTFGDGWKIEAVPAYNISEGKQQFHPQGRDNGYILTIDGIRIYIAGDTEDIPEMENIKNIDVAFLPCNQPFTMTPEQIAKVANIIKPKVLFPYHYGNTDIQQVVTLLEGTGIDVRIRLYQ